MATTYYSEAADGHIWGEGTTYANVRDVADGSSTTSATCRVGQRLVSPMKYIYRLYLSFDTSGIADDAVVSAATLYICVSGDQSVADFLVKVYRYAWAEALGSGANLEANYDGAYGSGTLEGTLLDTADGVVADTYYSMAVDTTGINVTGDTKYVLVSYEDVNNSDFSSNEFLNIYMSEQTGTDKDPYLVVTFTTLVEDTQVLQWDVATEVTDTQVLQWNVDAEVTDTQVLQWDVATQVVDTQVLQWDVSSAADYGANWWDENYTKRQTIEIIAPAGEAIPEGYSCVLTHDTADLVTAGDLRADRNDWRIVYWDGSTNTELDRRYIATDTTWFKIQAEIAAGATDHAYSVYYSYPSAGSPPETWADIYWWGDDFEDGAFTDWESTGGGSAVVSAVDPLSGSYSLLSTAGAATSRLNWRDFTATPSGSKLRMEWTFLADNVSDHVSLGWRYGNFQVAAVYAGYPVTGNYQYAAAIFTAIQNVTADTAYDTRLDIDTTAYTCDVYVDSVLKLSGKATRTYSQINRVWVDNYYTSRELRLDDILIRLLMTTAPTLELLGDLTEVEDTQVLQWDVSGETDVEDTQVLQWDVLNEIQDTQVLMWDLAGVMQDTQVLTWDVADWSEDIVSCPVRLERSIVRVDLAPSVVAVRLERSEVTVYLAEGSED